MNTARPQRRKLKSLARVTILKMALRISLVVVAVSLLSYFHLMGSLEKATKEQLSRYATDRAQMENQWLNYLDLQLLEIRQEFIDRYRQLGGIEPPGLYSKYFEANRDGTTYVQKKLYTGTPGPLGTRIQYISGGIDQGPPLSSEHRLRLVLAIELLIKYGPALVRPSLNGSPSITPFLDFYFFNREKDLEVYWPGTPWYPDFKGGFDLTAQGDWNKTFDMSLPLETRSRRWTGTYRDEVPKVWMVSLTSPIDIDGKNISALGADISLNDLNHRLHADPFPGSTSFIARDDGRLIAHPLLEKEMIERNGNYNLLQDGPAELKSAFQRIANRGAETVLDDTENDQLIAIAKIDAPKWVFVTIYPKKLMKSTAVNAILFVFILGIFSLLVEVMMLWLVLREQVIAPLAEFNRATEKIASGDLSDESMNFLPVGRNDELGVLARAFLKMTHALEASSRAKSEFLDIAAHELRTPLTPLRLLVDVIKEQGVSGKAITQEMVDIISRQISRLTSLVDDLLNASRLERSGFPIKPQSADLIRLTKECLEDFKRSAPERTFIFDGPQDLVISQIDPLRIAQVISNIIDNAMKYSPKESPIQVAVTTAPGIARVSIHDHGAGIPKSEQSGLFNRFYRAKSSIIHHQPGLGLGLYICRRIVELHHGTIGVESDTGSGTTITFTLPTDTI